MFKKITLKTKIIIIMIMSFLMAPHVILAKTFNNANKGIVSPAAINAVLCDDKIKELVKRYWKYVIILAPLVLIVMSSIEFLKAIMSSDADALTKSVSRTAKRVIALLILFFVPVILNIIFGWFNVEQAMCY